MLTLSQARGNERGGQPQTEHQGNLLPHGPPGEGHAEHEHGQGNAPDQRLAAISADQRDADLRIRTEAVEAQHLPLIHARLLNVDLQAAKTGEILLLVGRFGDRGTGTRTWGLRSRHRQSDPRQVVGRLWFRLGNRKPYTKRPLSVVVEKT